MLLVTILRAAEAQLPRLRLRHFKAYAAIVCRAVCHAWLTIFHGASCIDTLTAAAIKNGSVMLYINGRVVSICVTLPLYKRRGKYFCDGAHRGFFETIADVKKHLKTLAV